MADGIVADPERLAAVRARRQQLRDLCRKYGDDLGDVQRFHAEVAHRVAELEGYEERAAALDSGRRAALEAERRAAAVVGAARRAAAPQFGAAVTSRLRTLAMPHAELSVDVGDDDPGDAVELLLAANPGSPPLPLTRVASGGELARTMLALRLVAVDDTPTDRADASTVVFDEVDAGIGGAAAAAVAEALVAVASGHQVLVVTHLAQVAARADHQVTVSKRVAGGHTHTAAARSTATPASTSWPACCRAPKAARRPASTPPSCSTQRSRPDARGRGRLGSRPAGNPGNPHQRDGGPDG